MTKLSDRRKKKAMILSYIVGTYVFLILTRYFNISHLIFHYFNILSTYIVDYVNGVDEIKFHQLALSICALLYINAMIRSKAIMVTILFEMFRNIYGTCFLNLDLCMNSFVHDNVYQSVSAYIIVLCICTMLKQSKSVCKYFGEFIFTLVHHDFFHIIANKYSNTILY